jgi:hypothetical protein
MRCMMVAVVLVIGCDGGHHYTGLDGSSGDDASGEVDAPMPDANPEGTIVTNGQSAELVLGQADFTSATANSGGVSGRSLEWPSGIASTSTTLWVADTGNYRALRWDPLPLANHEYGDQVLGQPTLTNGTDPGATASASTLRIVNDAAISGTKLLVSDGNRVLVWSPLPATNGEAADLVLCQAELTHTTSGNASNRCSAPKGVWTDGTRVAVADAGNNRVLIWTSFPTTNGEAADLVLGQSAFGQSTVPTSPTASNMWGPTGVYFDGARFYVVDARQNRVMVWNSFPSQNNQAASFALGQPDLTSGAAATSQSGLNVPHDVAVVGDAVFVSDMSNDRVMVWTPIPTQSGVNAAHVLGQSNFTTAGGSPAPTPSSLDNPMGLVIAGSKLFVADYNHHRVLRFGLNLP